MSNHRCAYPEYPCKRLTSFTVAVRALRSGDSDELIETCDMHKDDIVSSVGVDRIVSISRNCDVQGCENYAVYKGEIDSSRWNWVGGVWYPPVKIFLCQDHVGEKRVSDLGYAVTPIDKDGETE